MDAIPTDVNKMISKNQASVIRVIVSPGLSRTPNSQTKWIRIVGLMCILVNPPAFAQVRRGTIVILGYSKEKVFMVADSRANRSGHGFEDSDCKIAALGNKMMFAGTGIGGFNWNDPNVRRLCGYCNSWDAIQEARNALSQAERPGAKIMPTPADRVEAVALVWEMLMMGDLTGPISFDSQVILDSMDTNDNILATGIFAGLTESGDPVAYVARLRCDKEWVRRGNPFEGHLILDRPLRYVSKQSVQYEAIGMPDTFNEYFLGKTAAAQREAERWKRQGPTESVADIDVLKAIRLADLTVAYRTEKQAEFIGGHIDAAEVTRDGKLQWIQRKPNCPAN